MNQAAVSHVDVMVVGAGCTGLAMSLSLADAGINVALIEKGACQHQQTDEGLDPWVSALNRVSQDVLGELNIWQNLSLQAMSPMTHMQVWDDASEGYFSFACTDIAEPDLGHIVANRALLSQLWERVTHSAGIQVFEHASVQDIDLSAQPVSIVLADGHKLSADLLIAADGAHSALRTKQMGAVRTMAYHQQAIVALVHHTKHHNHTARQRFQASGPIALLPLSDGHYSALIWSQDHAQADVLCQSKEDMFNQSLTQAFQAQLGALSVCGTRRNFKLQGHHVTQYGGSGWVLIGDAAHTIHPLAGQGLNLGLQDVKTLSLQIQQARHIGRSIGSASVIAAYTAKRRFANEVMLQMVTQLKRCFGVQHPFVCRLRELGMHGIERSPTLKRLLSKYALGIS